MMSGVAFLKNKWRNVAGLDDVDESAALPPLDVLKKTEWSLAFERLMKNRLILGSFRYGRLHAPGKKSYDRIGAIIDRAEQYSKTRNKEMLVDIAAIALCEFEEGDGFFKSTEEIAHVAEAR
jgi:hypothetical protein